MCLVVRREDIRACGRRVPGRVRFEVGGRGSWTRTARSPVYVQRVMRLIVGVAVVSLFAASGCGGGLASGGASHTQRVASTTVRHAIDASVSVAPSRSRVIYTIHGRTAAIGRFVGMCPKKATPRTAYEPTREAADAIAAVNGRGVSRAATLTFGQRLDGGDRATGLEHWLIRMGRESETVTVEASLEVVRQRGSPDCSFWLYGSVALLLR
jgi:hypothetical protein